MQGLALVRQGETLKREVKAFDADIIAYLEGLGVEAVTIDGKSLSITETKKHDFPIEHTEEVVQWCIDNGRMEYISITKQVFNSCCKAEFEAAEEEGREPILPPHYELSTFTKLNGL